MQLTLVNDFLKKRTQQDGIAEHKAMVDRKHAVSIKRQAELVGISRGSVYSRPRPMSAAALTLVRRIDELQQPNMHYYLFPIQNINLLNNTCVSIGFDT